MKNLFVTYEQAVALKALGFNEETFTWFLNETDIQFGNTENVGIDVSTNTELTKLGCISAPLKQQVFEWFRNNHGCDVVIQPCRVIRVDKANGYTCMIYTPKEEIFRWNLGNIHLTYEQAESACIDKLIELAR